MFYSYDILNIRKGKLAIAWLAATKRLNFEGLKKKEKAFKDVVDITISYLCDAIISHVNTAENLDDTMEVSRRFSLYLSSMLMFGTTRIYEFQVKFLLKEVTQALVSLRSKFECIANIDISKRRKRRSSKKKLERKDDPTFFGGLALDFDPDLLLHAFSDSVRVRGSLSKRSEDDSDVQRYSDPDSYVMDLMQDWSEPLVFPHSVHPRDITLHEEEATMRPMPFTGEQPPGLLEKIPEGDFGCGAGYFLPPDDFLTGPKQPQPETREEQEILVSEAEREILPQTDVLKEGDKIPAPEEEADGSLRPPQLETPLQPSAPAKEPPLKKKEKSKPGDDITVEQVIDDATKDKESPPHLVLEELQRNGAARVPRKPKSRKKITFFDDQTRISRFDMENRIKSYEDTMREKSASDDVINVTWWRVMKPASHLLAHPSRTGMSKKLNKLVTRFYNSSRRMEYFDFYSDARAMRKIRLEDISPPQKPRADKAAELSALSHLSSIPLDLTKSSSDQSQRTLTSTLFETPAVVPPQSDPAHLHSIQEEIQADGVMARAPFKEPTATPSQGFVPPKTMKPSVLFPPDDSKKRGTEAFEDEPAASPKKRKDAPLKPGMEGTATAPPPVREERPRRGKKRGSPEGGLSVVTVVAEVHADDPNGVRAPPEISSDPSSSFIEPPGPHPPRGPLAELGLSPVGKPRPSRITMTPDTQSQRRIDLLQSCHSRKRAETTLRDMLPRNPNRSDVASTFGNLLGVKTCASCFEQGSQTLKYGQHYKSFTVVCREVINRCQIFTLCSYQNEISLLF